MNNSPDVQCKLKAVSLTHVQHVWCYWLGSPFKTNAFEADAFQADKSQADIILKQIKGYV